MVFRSGVKERATTQVNILEAKTNLPKLVRLVETGRKDMITIARYGKPVANIVIFNDVPVSMRIGVAKEGSNPRQTLISTMMRLQRYSEICREFTSGYAYFDLGLER